MTDAGAVSRRAERYLGRPYAEADCQQLWENCLADEGFRLNLRGSNAWYRRMDWTGTPEACRARFGCVPAGACLFIVEEGGGEVARGYRDGLGDAVHMGIRTERGAIHSSKSRGAVCESAFAERTVPNGGWNRVGLWKALRYGERIDRILSEDREETKAEMRKNARVVARRGKTVRLRAKPSAGADVLAQVPVGAEVSAGAEQDGWRAVTWNGCEGWMMAEYLQAEEDALLAAAEHVEKALGILRELAGREAGA